MQILDEHMKESYKKNYVISEFTEEIRAENTTSKQFLATFKALEIMETTL